MTSQYELASVPSYYNYTSASTSTIDNVDDGDGLIFIINITPNIVEHTANVRIFNADKAVGAIRVLEIVNMNGTIMEDLKPRVNASASQQDIIVDVSSWAAGMYCMLISDDSQSGMLKIIKTGTR